MRSLVTVASCVLALLAPAVARAELNQPYGELTRFGKAGLGAGELTENASTHLIGVDPEGNKVFVLDEPNHLEVLEAEESGKSFTRELRIEEFTPLPNGEYHFTAQATFKLKSPARNKKTYNEEPVEGEIGELSYDGIEGIAVDPVAKRLYVLGAEYREQTLKIDSVARRPVGLRPLPVASTLYAFSTEANGEQLVPEGKEIGKTKNREPILVGKVEMEAQSVVPGKALLEPNGITVDPATHEVIVLAHEDHAGEVEDNLENPNGEDHYVLQRIAETGALGARYKDSKNFFEGASEGSAPNSPIVVGPPGAERVYVDSFGLVQVPYDFKSSEEPTRFTSLSFGTRIAIGGINPEIGTGQFGGSLSSQVGGVLATSPEGRIYFAAGVGNEELVTEQKKLENGEGDESQMSLDLLDGSSGSLVGWTGGQSLPVEKPGQSRVQCVIQPLHFGAEYYTPIAAGSEGKAFVLALGYLQEEAIFDEEVGGAVGAVIEFGPHGSGCPPARGQGPTTEVGGHLVESLPLGQPVRFSSYVRQADALKTEWNFGDGSEKVVSSSEQHCPFTLQVVLAQCPSVQHTYAAPGTYKVTETIETDDLATPTVALSRDVTVEGAAVPIARAIGPLRAVRGQPAAFDGGGSSDPYGANQITAYHWSFGDGQQETTGLPTTTHVYSNLGSYAASLTVTDRKGLTSAPAALPSPVTVVPEESPGSGPSGGTGQQSSAGSAGVESYKSSQPSPSPIPDVTLTNALLSASANGTLPLTLYCPAGETLCSGTVTLRGVVASAGGHGRNRRPPQAQTLASGSFAFAGGTRKRVLLRLTATARRLLAHTHTIRAQVTILARDPVGASHTTRVPSVVRAPAKAPSRRKR